MMAKPPSPPHFLYVPASSMASRRDIEQSSYSTTPALSQGAHTPPSGQMTYYLPEEELAAVDDVLRAKLIHGGLERVVLLEANDATTPKEINVEQSGGGGDISSENHNDIIIPTHPSPSPRLASQEEVEAEAEADGKKKPDTKEQLKGSKH
ncbi:hypothetical protein DTO021D3_3430 [Paecilomyces variotii]|nr:hypothetical protein DTO032I3_6544 [Paecilomyces variotii]KAJ9279639.1 hypothetical protein DTO021D3_3430 [Paecilomyces variotii]KAJ9347392.1 hypothetical protein DTO027B6_266 [Paecilomyces variotii]KAJ9358691.1 hypothetical protein DTO027B9_2364 [Paecilomyces variotii]KAJ9372247.1 hypothetical protein DTO282E5_3089 [Paecilomyces variotii]